MHIDYYDESGDITGRDSEIWSFPNWEEMGEHPDFEKFIQCLCRVADSRETRQESIFR